MLYTKEVPFGMGLSLAQTHLKKKLTFFHLQDLFNSAGHWFQAFGIYQKILDPYMNEEPLIPLVVVTKNKHKRKMKLKKNAWEMQTITTANGDSGQGNEDDISVLQESRVTGVSVLLKMMSLK